MMKRLAALFLASLIASTSSPASAQDFVGFDRSSFGNVVLNRNQSAGGGSDLQLELAVGSYNNESIRNYSPDSVFARMGQAVGRLDILTDKGIFPCTAFIVSDKHVLTNHHCVPGILDNEQAGATRIDAVQFVAGYTQQGVEEGTAKFTVIPVPVESSKELDYSVLEVIGDPSQVFGTLALSDREPRDGDPYWVIGHPMGEAQRISREKCKANTPALSQSRLLHTCDTLPGNSGSPVIDASLQKVVGLHHAGSKRDSVNFAIPMRQILAQSTVLAALVGAGDTATTTDATGGALPTASGSCDAFYTEAKTLGQCFAYEAYVAACSDHPYAMFATAYMAANCTAPPQDKPVDVVTSTPKPETLLRPWCGSSNLTPTESAICADTVLADLDAQLDAAYRAQSGRSTSAQQGAWRTGTRDACGWDSTCIYRAVTERIAYLRTPVAPAPPPTSGPRLVSGNYDLGSSRCYVVTASRPTQAEALAFANQWFPGRGDVQIFRSDNGWFAISAGIVAKSEADWRLNQLKSAGTIPSDSYCSTGNRFRAELLRSGFSAGGSSSGSGGVMYVDNNADGGLNVRPGPGTQYPYFTEIDAGTQLAVLGSSGKWSNVRLPDGRTGWVYTPLLTATKPYVRQCWGRVVNLRPRAQYNLSSGAGFLAVRTKPSTKTGQKISEVYLGDQVKIVAQKSGWARLECVSGGCTAPYQGSAGVRGWSSAKYLSINCN